MQQVKKLGQAQINQGIRTRLSNQNLVFQSRGGPGREGIGSLSIITLSVKHLVYIAWPKKVLDISCKVILLLLVIMVIYIYI